MILEPHVVFTLALQVPSFDIKLNHCGLAVGFESMLGVRIHGSKLGSEPQILAPSSEPRSVAPRYRSRQRHLGFPIVHGQAPRRQDLWRQDVLPRRHDSWRRPTGSKDEFKSFRRPNVNFLQNKKDEMVKIWACMPPSGSPRSIASPDPPIHH